MRKKCCTCHFCEIDSNWKMYFEKKNSSKKLKCIQLHYIIFPSRSCKRIFSHFWMINWRRSYRKTKQTIARKKNWRKNLILKFNFFPYLFPIRFYWGWLRGFLEFSMIFLRYKFILFVWLPSKLSRIRHPHFKKL